MYSCPVLGCRQSCSSPAYLRRHLSQSTDSSHKKHSRNVYSGLDFDVAAAVRSKEATFPPAAPLETFSVVEDKEDEGEYEGEDEEEAILDPDDCVEDQSDRELVVEEVSEDLEDLDAVAEIMDDVLKGLHLSSEEELAEYLPVPDIVEEIQVTSKTTSSSRKLEEAPDTRITMWDQAAGRVLSINPSSQERWNKLFGYQGHKSDEYYEPFGSQVDWELSRWAVREKIGQGSFNQLLGIPGVRSSFNCFAYFTEDHIPFR